MTAPLKILVAIANHGTKNDGYAKQLIDEYRGMSHDVDIVILTNIDKNWGDDVEIRIGLPSKNPWSLPFGHRQIFAERIEDYDLFIYTEDDTLLSEANVASFLRVTEILDDDEIAGFMRSEQADDGHTFLSTVHSFYHWDPASVKSAEGHVFAHFTNEHAACYILTREQLRRSIISGGFVVPPHEGRYDLLVTAATDPYTQCGYRKMVCISHVDEFILKHLPSAYLGQLGLGRQEFDLQLGALQEIAEGNRPTNELITAETKARHGRWSKNYYEAADDRIYSAISRDARDVLSVGCGWGATEARLAGSGRNVVAVTLDSVIAACAEHREIESIYGSTQEIVEKIGSRTFDTLVLSNVLHLAREPQEMLRVFSEFLRPGGEVLVLTPNLRYVPTTLRRLARQEGYRNLGDQKVQGLHLTSASKVRKWLSKAGLRVSSVEGTVNPRFAFWNRLTCGLLRHAWTRELLVVGRRS